MNTFRILFGIDGSIAAIVLFFLVYKLGGGSISASNTVLGVVILGVIAVALGVSAFLRSRGKARLANGVLLVLACVGILGLVFIA
ncbi:MAG: hypothetical protein J0H14_20875 [Alphaproteobacteria bacterium]|nr:hypothetical protein [Alphaproteobacteria bacterium]